MKRAILLFLILFTAIASAQVTVTKEGYPKFPKTQGTNAIAATDTVLIKKVAGIVMGIAYGDFISGLGGGTALSFSAPLINSGGTVTLDQSQITAPWAGLTGVPPNIDINKLDDFSGDFNDLLNKPDVSTPTLSEVLAEGSMINRTMSPDIDGSRAIGTPSKRMGYFYGTQFSGNILNLNPQPGSDTNDGYFHLSSGGLAIQASDGTNSLYISNRAGYDKSGRIGIRPKSHWDSDVLEFDYGPDDRWEVNGSPIITEANASDFGLGVSTPTNLSLIGNIVNNDNGTGFDLTPIASPFTGDVNGFRYSPNKLFFESISIKNKTQPLSSATTSVTLQSVEDSGNPGDYYGYIALSQPGTTGSDRLTNAPTTFSSFGQNNNVKIGGSPFSQLTNESKLQVDGDLNITGAYKVNGVDISAPGSSDNGYFNVNASVDDDNDGVGGLLFFSDDVTNGFSNGNLDKNKVFFDGQNLSWAVSGGLNRGYTFAGTPTAIRTITLPDGDVDLTNLSGATAADAVTYNNTTSGLAATNTQAAIDEIVAGVSDEPAYTTVIANEYTPTAGVVGDVIKFSYEGEVKILAPTGTLNPGDYFDFRAIGDATTFKMDYNDSDKGKKYQTKATVQFPRVFSEYDGTGQNYVSHIFEEPAIYDLQDPADPNNETANLTTYSLSSGTTISVETGIVNNGTRSVKATNTGVKGDLRFQMATGLTIGNTYQVQIDVYEINDSAAANTTIGVYDFGGFVITDTAIVPSKGAWQTMTFTGEANANSIFLRASTPNPPEANLILYYDNIVITDTTP